MLKYIVGLFVALFVVTSSAFAFNVYDKPENNAKVVMTLKADESVIPIFYTEKKDWVKIANPKNGDIGWVKASELKAPMVITKVTEGGVQQQVVIDKDKEPNVYSVIQYSAPHEMTKEETQKMVKDFERRQNTMRESMKKMHDDMQKMMQDMFKDFDDMFVPVPITPEKK